MKTRYQSIVVSLFLFAVGLNTTRVLGQSGDSLNAQTAATQPAATQPAATQPAATQPAATQPDAEDTDATVREHSDAERIAELTEAIDSDKEQCAALIAEFDSPESEYAMAEREFRSLNESRDKLLEELETAKADSKTPAATVENMTSDVDTQTTLWRLAKDRFDLAIEDRKTLKEQLYTLKHKLQQDQEALQLLTDGPQQSPDEDIKSKRDDKSVDSKDEKRESSSENNADERSNDSENNANDQRNKEEDDDAEVDEELVKAQEESEQKEAEVKEAEEETESIEARLRGLQQLIAQEQKELNIARKKVDLASAAQHDLGVELNKVQSENADPVELNTLKSAISKANQRFIQARSEVTEINERLNDHRAELSSLQAEHIIALHEEQKKREEALASGQHVADLKNPFTLRNILQWLLDHGPRLLLITVGMFVLNRAATLLASRSVRLVTTGSMRGSKAERENRAKTLVGVFQNAATVGLFITGSLMILEELGANITVLMGGVAVIGLAVAFGAQNLIKDYFYGFVMLLENQYMLNDTVRISLHELSALLQSRYEFYKLNLQHVAGCTEVNARWAIHDYPLMASRAEGDKPYSGCGSDYLRSKQRASMYDRKFETDLNELAAEIGRKTGVSCVDTHTSRRTMDDTDDNLKFTDLASTQASGPSTTRQVTIVGLEVMLQREHAQRYLQALSQAHFCNLLPTITSGPWPPYSFIADFNVAFMTAPVPALASAKPVQRCAISAQGETGS